MKLKKGKSLGHVRLSATPWTGLLCPLDFPGQNTGVGCHFLLQGIFPTQGSNPGLPHCRQALYHLSHQGKQGVCLNTGHQFCQKPWLFFHMSVPSVQSETAEAKARLTSPGNVLTSVLSGRFLRRQPHNALESCRAQPSLPTSQPCFPPYPSWFDLSSSLPVSCEPA